MALMQQNPSVTDKEEAKRESKEGMTEMKQDPSVTDEEEAKKKTKEGMAKMQQDPSVQLLIRKKVRGKLERG